MSILGAAEKWLASENIRPYVFMRKENRISSPGTGLSCEWFDSGNVIYKDPLTMSEVGFADAILNLEGKAFQQSDMRMPRWVFYDCAVVPGFVCGFAQHRDSIAPEVLAALGETYDQEWLPISLFIIIPTVRKGEWVAHNLCTVNSLVSRKEKYYALGFLTKAFGLWYANVEVLCGMTQWKSPAIRLHSTYGPFEILTAYTPVHSYARTLTYRTRLDSRYWESFFTKRYEFVRNDYQDPVASVDPGQDKSLKDFQRRIEEGQGPFYFNPEEVRVQDLNHPIQVYHLAVS